MTEEELWEAIRQHPEQSAGLKILWSCQRMSDVEGHVVVPPTEEMRDLLTRVSALIEENRASSDSAPPGIGVV